MQLLAPGNYRWFYRSARALDPCYSYLRANAFGRQPATIAKSTRTPAVQVEPVFASLLALLATESLVFSG